MFGFINGVFIWLMTITIVLFHEYKVVHRVLTLFSQILLSPWHNGIFRSLTLLLMEGMATWFCCFKQLCVNSILDHQPPKFAKPLESFGSKHLLSVRFYYSFGCEFKSLPAGQNWIALLILLSWSNFIIL